MSAGRKILVVGSGGREHALAVRLARSPSVATVMVLPGNGGTARPAPRGAGAALVTVAGDTLAVAERERPDLVVIGPEAPLCDGVADALRARGLRVFGPSRAAAQLEGSKRFMKDFAKRHGLRTARHEVVTSAAEVEAVVRGFAEPPVVKADGLCAGKGVVVAESHDEAIRASREMLLGARFGAAGLTVVIEERLAGVEASVHAICDGERALVLPAAQDHKRIGDGDTGPNTGGMGTYAPTPVITPALAEQIERELLQRAVDGMASEGTPYRGALFAGIMLTPAGEPVLLEFNVRFGDPETQVLMSVIEGDLAEALFRAADGALEPGSLRASGEHAVCVVLAAAGYPGTPRTGDVITGVEAAEEIGGVTVYHAGTRRDGARLLTSGGRVLGVTARGASLEEAHARAYRAAELIHFEGKQLRRDIAARALTARA
ncbi:MAG: phosphoribosylamine--glycine ligase [Sorangiineae bacterium]|nr:phosphoribosylamine--glycine ligase [Polyangiaceae bacterium]MEB2324652.1 phosphoribosylamine--glycine ligase [Sorangiineae bacterium]